MSKRAELSDGWAVTFSPFSSGGDYYMRFDRPNANCVNDSAVHCQCEDDAQDHYDEGGWDACPLFGPLHTKFSGYWPFCPATLPIDSEYT